MATDATNATWLEPFEEIRRALADDPEWGFALGSPGTTLPTCGIHLAVFNEPFLGFVLDGSKTIESRFSINRCAPFGRVRSGDVILLKQPGGPVVGIARVSLVWSYHLDESSWKLIREQFTEALRVQDPEFWEQKSDAFYATLMSIDRVRALKPIEWEKKDRRGWVVMQRVRQLYLFRDDDDF